MSLVQQQNIYFDDIVTDIEDYAIILLDTNGIIVSWNKGAEKIKGYTEEEIKGKSFENFYRAEDRDAGLPNKLLNEAKLTGRVQDEGWRLAKGDDLFWAYVVITATKDKDGNHTGYIKITRDLSERLAAEQVIDEYERSLHEQSEHNDLMKELYLNFITKVEDYAIIMLNKEGYIVDWNVGAEKIKGYKSEEIIGRHFSTLYPDDDVKSLLPDALLKKAQVDGLAQYEGWRLKKDGTMFWGNITLKALYDDKHMVKGYVKITKDLTKKVLSEKAISDYASKLESEIQKISGAGSEQIINNWKIKQSTYFRTKFEHAAANTMQKPGYQILNTIQSLKETLHSDEDINHMNNILIASRQFSKQLIDQALMAVVLEDGIDITPSTFDLKSEIELLIDTVQMNYYNEQDVHFAYSGNEMVNLPLALIKYIIENLLTNSIKFSPADSMINIVCNSENKLSINCRR